MKNQNSLIFGLGVLIWVLGVIIWVFRSGPSQAEIYAATVALPALPTTALSDQSFEDLAKRTINGTLPVTPLLPEPSRTDPFR